MPPASPRSGRATQVAGMSPRFVEPAQRKQRAPARQGDLADTSGSLQNDDPCVRRIHDGVVRRELNPSLLILCSTFFD